MFEQITYFSFIIVNLVINKAKYPFLLEKFFEEKHFLEKS